MPFLAFLTKIQNIRVVKESEKVINYGINFLKIYVKSVSKMSKNTQYMMINYSKIIAK